MEAMDRIFSCHPAAKDAHGAVALPLQAFGAIALGLALGALALGVLALGDISLALGDISLALGTLVLALRRKRW